MKKLITAFAILSLTAAHAAQPDDPSIPFDAQKGRYATEMPIEWRLADNVNTACDAESRRVGNGGFKGQNVQACAFWYKNKCTIITKKKPTMHAVGHEIRHCFQGEWH